MDVLDTLSCVTSFMEASKLHPSIVIPCVGPEAQVPSEAHVASDIQVASKATRKSHSAKPLGSAKTLSEATRRSQVGKRSPTVSEAKAAEHTGPSHEAGRTWSSYFGGGHSAESKWPRPSCGAQAGVNFGNMRRSLCWQFTRSIGIGVVWTLSVRSSCSP